MHTQSIANIMTKQVHLLDVNATLPEAQEMMNKKKIHHLPVMAQGKMVGILSANDLKKVQYKENEAPEDNNSQTTYIKDLMTSNVRKLDISTTISEATEVLKSADFQCLPVMNEEELVGILTTKDLLGYLQKNNAGDSTKATSLMNYTNFVD